VRAGKLDDGGNGRRDVTFSREFARPNELDQLKPEQSKMESRVAVEDLFHFVSNGIDEKQFLKKTVLSCCLLILRTEVGNFSHQRPEGYMSGA
jgi:hypothetical protein